LLKNLRNSIFSGFLIQNSWREYANYQSTGTEEEEAGCKEIKIAGVAG